MSLGKLHAQRKIKSLERLDAKDDGALGEAGKFFHFEEGGFELAKGTLVEEEDHFHEICIRMLCIDGGVGTRDTDLMFGEDGGDVGDDAGLVVDRKTDVI